MRNRSTFVRKNREHFEKIDEEHRRHFGKNDDNIFYMSKLVKGITRIEEKLVERDLTILKEAEKDGYIKVDWFMLLWDRKENSFTNYLNNIVQRLGKLVPAILTDWNKNFKTNTYKKVEEGKVATVLKNPINISNTNNDNYFLNLNKIQKDYFDKGINNLTSKIENSSKMEQDDLVRLAAELKVIRDANSDGLVIMDWDRFFKLSQKNLITAVDEITKLINTRHLLRMS
ncbi:TPA: hypothetical protein GXZ34_02700 [bacterium]|nr:hypothetical protein [bacterium]